jgi:rubrerythrin
MNLANDYFAIGYGYTMPVDDSSFISSICLNCGFMLGEFVPGMECPMCGEPIL